VLCTIRPPWYPPKHMFVLGIDPGLTATGYGIIEARAGTERAVAAGVIRTDPSDPTAVRLVELHRDLADLIREHAPDAAALERVFVNANRRTAISVARAAGVTILALAQAGLDPAEYTPSGVKMALTGNGDADKDQMRRALALRLDLPSAPAAADAADALAVALCHVQHLPRIAIEASA
jgi:crossover junction endodeoxyribonuclease RuvC